MLFGLSSGACMAGFGPRSTAYFQTGRIEVSWAVNRGLLGQIKAIDLHAELFYPIDVGRETNQGLVDIDAAYARDAANRRFNQCAGYNFPSPNILHYRHGSTVIKK